MPELLGYDVRGSRAFLTLFYIERDALAFSQRLES
jgi:hypothetical protein